MGMKASLIAACVNVVLPALIVSFLSAEELLGPSGAFLMALVLPLAYGVIYLMLHGRMNIFSVIGLVSIILTGSFGVMELSPSWLIAKETGIPLLIGMVILYTGKRKRPFLGMLLSEIMDMHKVGEDYSSRKSKKTLAEHVRRANAMFASVFFIGALLNFFVAFSVLSAEPGTSEYASEVGRLTALSYPLIVLPVIVMLFVVFAVLAGDIEKSTGKDISAYMK